jgi:O-antigen/teichoic acid export membrane protein
MILSFKNISINGVQVLVNQCLGMGVFLLLSRYLDKSVFGEFSWSLAVLTLTLTLSGLGLDQIVVRNVAAGKEASHQLTLFAFHTGLMVLLLAGGLLAGYYEFPAFFTLHPVLWMLAISQALTSFALPFRQLITGKSAYGWLAIQATVPNLVRLSGLIMLALLSMLTMRSVLLLFILSSLLEYLTGFYIVIKRLGIPFYRRIPAGNYISLIRDSLPQAGMIFLQMGIARADWILLGLFSTALVTAEYSFAYRAYELSPLPLLILAPP